MRPSPLAPRFATNLATCAALLATTALAHPQSALVGWGQYVFDSGWKDASIAQGQARRGRAGPRAAAPHRAARRGGVAVGAGGDNYARHCNVPEFPQGLGCVRVAA